MSLDLRFEDNENLNTLEKILTERNCWGFPTEIFLSTVVWSFLVAINGLEGRAMFFSASPFQRGGVKFHSGWDKCVGGHCLLSLPLKPPVSSGEKRLNMAVEGNPSEVS